MELVEIRRARLKEWFGDKKLPPKDASFISQVIGGKFIGEKAARRLERDHGLPDLFLDTPYEEPGSDPIEPKHTQSDKALPEKLLRLKKCLEILPNEDADALLDEFLERAEERKKYFERLLQEYIQKNQLKNI
ncbi:hypothetical protein [Enterobacter vonholyi]|uniref:hypothetical protein n=1 Tax=Enterobacter vonholyi TaxID=2797505 RepID=UPI002665CCA9|nr:hypothetical protein [Enterobacter vonholyi]MDO2449750.1 hypothetical protein [Enterobacter vonholyi]